MKRLTFCRRIAAFVLLAAVAWASDSGQYLLYVGTYTGPDSKGIYAYRYDAVTSKLTPLGVAAETTNPSFLAVDPTQRFLYAVNEVQKFEGAESGYVSAFAVDKSSGKLRLLNTVASGGADPCYISLDRTGKFLLVANYTGGSVAVFPVQADGKIGRRSAFAQHSGAGPDKSRQEGPHAHWVETTPDNRFAVVADLGLDQLKVYRFDARAGTLAANDPPFGKVDDGAGPRHVAFHPNGKLAFALNEIHSTITVFAYDAKGGAFRALSTVPALPQGFAGENTTAEIHVHPNGRLLFASNRGHDSIAVFRIEESTGGLSLVGHFPTRGKEPRNFEIDPTGKLLLVANQKTNDIEVFRIDLESGKLSFTGQTIGAPTPVSLRFVRVE